MQGIGGWGAGHGLSGAFLPWILVIVGLFLLVRWLTGAGKAGGFNAGTRAWNILDNRYARDEMSKEAFESMKRDLT